MEDAHLNAMLSDKKSYLFAVFDGHGGNCFTIQVLKWLPSSSVILLNNCKKASISSIKIMNLHSSKLS